MRIVVGLSVLVLVFLTATVQADDEKEKKISVSDCPKVVQKTLKHEAGKGKIVDVDVRKINGVAIYESEVRFGKLEYDIVIRGDGTLLSKRLENDGDDKDSDKADDDEDEGDEKDGGDEDEDEKETETPVRMADLPKSVMKTLKREARGGEIEEIEKETEGDKVVYEAEVEFGKKEYEIEIAEDGTLLSKMLEEERDDEEDKDDADDKEDEEDDDDDDQDEDDDD